MSGFLSYSQDPEKKFLSPLNQGRIDRAYENLDIRLLHVPSYEDFIKTAMFGKLAQTGGAVNPVEEFDGLSADELVKRAGDFRYGGLEQFMESDTVTFMIYGCSRGFTHELVRTRNAWYLQQTMRHTYMENANIRMPEGITKTLMAMQFLWINSVRESVSAYVTLCETGDLAYQDARTVLPIGTETWIIAGMHVREFLKTYGYRACWMFYPEMRWIFQEIGRQVGEACPWLADQVKITCEKGPEEERRCDYKGNERVDEICPFVWGRDDNRAWVSGRFAK